MWKILLEEFIGDLRTQKTRAALTMFAITWGTIAVVLLLSFGEGLKVAIRDGLLNAGERIFMVYGGQTSREFEGLPTGRIVRLTEEDLATLRRSIPEIEMGSPSYGRWGTSIKWGETKTNTYMEGVYPEFSEMRRVFAARGGRFINQDDLDSRRRVIFFGDAIAKRIFGAADPVGQTVLLDGLPFTVIGVMQSKFQDSSNNGPDEDRAIIPASTMKAIYGYRWVGHLIVRPREVRDHATVKRQLYEVMGRRYRFDPDDERALGMWDFIEDQKETTAIGVGIQLFLGLIGAFTLIIAGVGVANIMYVVVRERTREIGIKLAVGARKLHIMSQFVFEAVLLALMGGAIGLAVSGLLVFTVRSLPTEGNDAMRYIAHPILSWPIAGLCVSILVFIGLAAGILPARRAAAVDPVESLRYE
jgi:putative ABC transport system permease protein